jgi:hypothetical protein
VGNSAGCGQTGRRAGGDIVARIAVAGRGLSISSALL